MEKFVYEVPELLEVSYTSVVSGVSCAYYTSNIDAGEGCTVEGESPEYE